MAAPPEITLKNLSGKYVMNKSLSDDIDPVLSLQGMGWLTRKAVGLATVTLLIKQYTDDTGTIHIDIEQIATGGLKGTTELRQLNGQEGRHTDHLFGDLTGKSTWVKLSEVTDDFLKEGWEDSDGEFMRSWVVADKGWTAEQIWGFAEVGGKRYYVRRVVVKNGDKEEKIRSIYEYKGPL